MWERRPARYISNRLTASPHHFTGPCEKTGTGGIVHQRYYFIWKDYSRDHHLSQYLDLVLWYSPNVFIMDVFLYSQYLYICYPIHLQMSSFCTRTPHFGFPIKHHLYGSDYFQSPVQSAFFLNKIDHLASHYSSPQNISDSVLMAVLELSQGKSARKVPSRGGHATSHNCFSGHLLCLVLSPVITSLVATLPPSFTLSLPPNQHLLHLWPGNKNLEYVNW